MSNARVRHRSGFTLIEVVIVLALLGLSLAVAVPRIAHSDALDHEVRLRTAAGLLRGARVKALEDGVVRHVEVDVAERSVRYGGRIVRFGGEVAVRATLADRDVTGGSRARFTFFPDGSARGGALLFERAGQVRWVAVDWLTGRVTLHHDPAEPAT